MIFIETLCPICTTGTIGFRRCASGDQVVLMCDECDSVWRNPMRINAHEALYPQPPDFVVPALKCSVRPPLSIWATREDIIRHQWAQYIHGEGKALDES